MWVYREKDAGDEAARRMGKAEGFVNEVYVCSEEGNEATGVTEKDAENVNEMETDMCCGDI